MTGFFTGCTPTFVSRRVSRKVSTRLVCAYSFASSFASFAKHLVLFCIVIVMLGVGQALWHPLQAQDSTAIPRINLSEFGTDNDKPLFIRYGAFLGPTWQFHQANFTEFTGCATCAPDNYGAEEGRAASFGVLFEYPVWNRFIAAIRLSYMTGFGETGFFSTDFRSRELLTISYPNSAGQAILNIDHTFRPSLGVLSAEPLLSYRPLDYLSVYVGAQFRYFVQKQYTYLERITDPSEFVGNETQQRVQGTVTFENDQASRNARSGELPGLRTLDIAPGGGLSYEIPLNATGTTMLALEGFYFFGLSSFVDGSNRTYTSKVVAFDTTTRRNTTTTADGSWLMSGLRGSVSLRFSPYRTIRPELTPELQEKIRQLQRYDSLVTEERKRNAAQLARMDSVNKVIAAKMQELKKIGISVNLSKVVGVDENGTEIPKPTLTIEQFRTGTTTPVFNHIYFEDNSAVLPSRYRRIRSADRNTFKIAELAGKPALEVYRNVLNIIGQRMNDNPASVLFVTGCNAGVGAEKDNTKLSEQRAQAISDYLQDVWKIQGKRIVVQKQNLPDKPSTAAGDLAAAENRRVELSSNLPEIFEPIKGDNITKLANPPVLRFGIDINAGAGLKQWELEASQFVDNEAITLKNFNGTKEYPPSVDWKLNEEPNTIPQSGQDISVQLTMTDVNNKTGDAPITSIPVEQITVERKELDGKPDKRIDVYDVIGFDAGTNLDEAGQKLIETIKKSLKPNARVILTAYTDNTVDAAQSKDIAKRRADAVGKAIGASNPTVRAVGVTQMNDNSLPEGRAYNRLVRVEVQTPVR